MFICMYVCAYTGGSGISELSKLSSLVRGERIQVGPNSPNNPLQQPFLITQ